MSENKVLTVKEASASKEFQRVVETVKNGGIIIFPTDTVYGIGASVKFSESIDKIYRIKKRPKKKPIVILMSSWRESSHLVGRVSQRVRTMMKEYWPGATTLILSGRARPIALRVPNHKFALQLLSAVGPMAVTSANISGEPAPAVFSGIEKDLLKQADIVIKDEKPLKGVSSTIIDVTSGEIEIIREGKL
ncbi:MAG: threonylcarbamoyl-AMP synthase [Elusimicrobia bacterium CG08_land_8_20_14_0_20_44_26]|nr:MAG: threonylcarbamoyl-AMP synthase [Elusimicrobia bacterium CG08_land_8_20_14_0_20_44_26]